MAGGKRVAMAVEVAVAIAGGFIVHSRRGILTCKKIYEFITVACQAARRATFERGLHHPWMFLKQAVTIYEGLF